MLVAGDAGVGKSRLIGEFCRTLAYSRWKIGSGTCVEFASRPYGPMLEALGQLSGGSFQLGEAPSKRQQFDAILARIGDLATQAAIVIAIEDVHWADAATLDLLVYLSTRIERMRVLLLASFRAEELHPEQPAARAAAQIARAPHAGRIDLAPLRGNELQTFIDEALGKIRLSDETRRAVASAGEGNPFFTEELLKSAVERSAPARRSERRVPSTLRATLIERLRPFDEAERTVIAQAAMIGRAFSLELLAATLDTETEMLLPVLRKARDFQLVEETAPAAFRFRHGLTREAIYGDYLGAELQPRHRAIAIALEDAAPERRSLEALAYHWWAAGDAERAARYNELAGDAAGAVHAHEDALGFYQRALEFDVEALRRGAILKKIADRRLATGATKEAQAAYASAADLFQAVSAYEREAASRAAAAITAYGIGLPDPMQPLEAMLTRLDTREYVARGRVLLGLAWLTATFGFPSRATDYLARVDHRALAEARDIALRFHNVAAFAAMTRGDVDGFRREHAQWIEAAAASESPQALAGAYTNGAMCRAFFGLHEEAQRDLDSAFRLAGETKSRHLEESAYAFAALCAMMRGDLRAVRDSLEHVSPASENRVNIIFATAWGSLAGAWLDDATLIERWFDEFEASSPAETECAAGFAELMVRRGRPRDAERFLERALPDCEILRGNVMALLAAGRYGNAKTRERARAFLERAAAAPAETPERAGLALFDAFERSRAGEAAAAKMLAEDAAEGFRTLRMPLLEAQARELAGETEAALALYRRCGANYHVRRLTAADSAHAGAIVRADEPVAKVLSRREREIALLAAAGRSNLEIADALSISHKTVEKHLASVYDKFAISSRAQIAARLAGQATG